MGIGDGFKWKLFDRIGYKPHHENVRRFHESEAKVKVVSAPRRGSKSYSASVEALVTVIQPHTRVWIVGPSYGLAEKEFRYIHQFLVLERHKLGLPKPEICRNNVGGGQLLIKWPEPWGSVVEGKTADRPESLLGEAVDLVIYSEAAQLPRAIRERYVAPTLVTKQGIELIPTTPDAGAEWVHELVEAGQNSDYPEIESFHWGVNANPAYPMEEFERAKKFYGEDSPVFREQYLGEWVFYGGLVYAGFTEDDHVIEPFDIPYSWPRLRAVDFGHRDPFVCLWAAVGPQNELYFYREYYIREGRSMREHASNIKALSRGERIVQTVGDPSSAQSIEDLCYEGISVVPANNDRQAGRARVLEYILPTSDGVVPFSQNGDIRLKAKYPRMYFFNTLPETIREIKYYRWQEAEKNKEGMKEKTEGEDHAMDTMRYLVMERPSPFRAKKRVPYQSFQWWQSKYRTPHYAGQYIGGIGG